MLRSNRLQRAALAALLLAPSCVSFQFTSEWREEPVDTESPLEEGRAQLREILARHGAPVLVRPAADGGMWLIWAWSAKGGWQVRVSYAFDRFLGASLSWQEDDEDIEGFGLLIDKSDVLVRRSTGRLSDILRGVQDPRRERRTGRSGLRRTGAQ